MKKLLNCFLLALMASCILVACKKKEISSGSPIPPILKEILFPEEKDAIPGRDVLIQGKGFSKEDVVFLQSTATEVQVPVIEATNAYIKFTLPKDAGGLYKITIERDGQKTMLDGTLSVPFVVPLDDVVLPANNVQQLADVTIGGKGFEAGDIVQLSADFYPAGKVVNIPVTATPEGISFKLPQGVYGVNTVVVSRGNRKTNLGIVKIEVNVGDVVGGGVVFWTDVAKLHGLIVSKTNVGTPVEQFGPGVALSGAAGTSKAMQTGMANTAKLLTKMAAFRSGSASWNNKKTAAELCDELVVTEGSDSYGDWFLPSQEELITLFKAKALMATKGAEVPPNNYWSSSEGDSDAAGWAAFYVNFYESTNVVSGIADKEGWSIGVRAVRAF
jgi:hypothetical protein